VNVRRLDTGAVVRRVRDIYVEEASVLMPAAATVFVFQGIVSGVLASSETAGGFVAAVLVYLVATVLLTGMVAELVADLQDGRRDSSWRQLLSAMAPVAGRLIVVALAAAAGAMVGFALFVLPGLVLVTLWAVAAPVVVLERPPGLQALRRSRELVQGNALRVFGVILLLYLFVAVVAGGIDLAADSAGTGVGIVVRVITGVLIAPLPALSASVLYFELRRAHADTVAPGRGAEPPERSGELTPPADTA
jgi:hypothetical protein